MAIPKKPRKNNVDTFIDGAKATRADQTTNTTSAAKKMWSVRIDPTTIKKVKIWASLTDQTKEEIAQEAFDLYFADKDVPTQ